MYRHKLNILLILPQNYDPNMPSRPEITEIYGKYLPSLNHNIIWICPSYTNRKGIKKEKYNQVVIYTIPRKSASSVFGKGLNFVKFYYAQYKFLLSLQNQENFDIVQVRNDVFSALIALSIKYRYRIPLVFQYSFPITVFKSHIDENKHLYYFGIVQNWLQKYILKNSDFIFPISKWMEAELVAQGIPNSNMMPLPMGVNPELFDLKIDGQNLRKKYTSNGSKLLIYVGSMDKLRALDVIIDAFSEVHKSHQNVKMLMLGDGNDKENLEELSIKLGLQENIIFIGQVPYFDVPLYISAADVCLSPIPPLDIYKVSSPTKLFEAMVMSKAVVANEEIPEQKEALENSDGGILVEFHASSFADGIKKLLDNPAKAKEMGSNGYEWVKKNRSYEEMAHNIEIKYYELLESY